MIELKANTLKVSTAIPSKGSEEGNVWRDCVSRNEKCKFVIPCGSKDSHTQISIGGESLPV
jgi:hypothetical protein